MYWSPSSRRPSFVNWSRLGTVWGDVTLIFMIQARLLFTWPKTFLFTYLNQVTFSVGFLSVLLLRTPSSTSQLHSLWMPEYKECCLDSDSYRCHAYLSCLWQLMLPLWLLPLWDLITCIAFRFTKPAASVSTARLALHRRVISSRMLGLPSQIYFSHSWKMYLLESISVGTTLNASP